MLEDKKESVIVKPVLTKEDEKLLVDFFGLLYEWHKKEEIKKIENYKDIENNAIGLKQSGALLGGPSLIL